MSLRRRLTLAAGGAVCVALAIASLVIYFAVRSKLHDQIDFSLIQSAQEIVAKSRGANAPAPPKVPLLKQEALGRVPDSKQRSVKGATLGSDALGYFQVIPNVRATGSAGPSGFVPLIARDRLVSSGAVPPYFRDVSFRGVEMRLYATPLGSSRHGLVRTARPLTEANATITRVRWLLLGITLAGALAAALLGRLMANAVLRPVRALAGAVREVSATRDLNRRIPVSGRDELASLASDFNAMLSTLKESQRAQQQLIADASHELRTPLTAHRTNIELLARPDLPAAQPR